MMKELNTTVEIAATPGQVWQVLIDFAAYAEWNPFIVNATGTATTGSRLALRMQPVGARAMTLKPVVRDVMPERRLRWLGRLIMPGILTAEHTFTIEARD